MAEELIISSTSSKEEKYLTLLPQLKALIDAEPDTIANLSNIISALKYTFNWLWVGIYFVKNNQLVLGPFQGPIACSRIDFGKGVCGTAWKNKQTTIVPDVNQFPNHIACSTAAQSEIVLPVINEKNEVIMVLDIDSQELTTFDETDQKYLEQVVEIIKTL